MQLWERGFQVPRFQVDLLLASTAKSGIKPVFKCLLTNHSCESRRLRDSFGTADQLEA